MTLQDLKDNKEQILEQMEFVGVHPKMHKQFMQTMIEFAEIGLNENEDVCDFVNQIFDLNDLRKQEWMGKTLSQSQLDREYLAAKEVEDREAKRSSGKNDLEINRSF